MSAAAALVPAQQAAPDRIAGRLARLTLGVWDASFDALFSRSLSLRQAMASGEPEAGDAVAAKAADGRRVDDAADQKSAATSAARTRAGFEDANPDLGAPVSTAISGNIEPQALPLPALCAASLFDGAGADAATTAPESAPQSAARPASPAEQAERQITVAHSDRGVELYLRDAVLSTAAAIDIAASLRWFCARQDVHLQRLVVNGRNLLNPEDEPRQGGSLFKWTRDTYVG